MVLTAAGLLLFCGAVENPLISSPCLAAGCHGRPYAGQRIDSCGNHGCCGCVSCNADVRNADRDALTSSLTPEPSQHFLPQTIALTQNDIKKVLAYSTVSQLGYMIMGLGVGAYTAGFFHLTTHAMFKAGLFLGSGSLFMPCTMPCIRRTIIRPIRRIFAIWADSGNGCR